MSDLANHLREHADRVAGGGTGEPEYDPETLVLEHDAADRIEALAAEVERLRGTLRQVRDITNCSAVNHIVRAALAGE